MATTRRSRKRTLRRRLRRIGTAVACVALAVTTVLAVIATSGSESGNREPFDGLSAVEAALLEKAVKASVDPSRPNYPFSVIDRGVYNANELGAAMSRDHVVAAHYKGVSL